MSRTIEERARAARQDLCVKFGMRTEDADPIETAIASCFADLATSDAEVTALRKVLLAAEAFLETAVQAKSHRVTDHQALDVSLGLSNALADYRQQFPKPGAR